MKQEKNHKTKRNSIRKRAKINNNKIKNSNSKNTSKEDKNNKIYYWMERKASKYYKEISTKWLQFIRKRCFIKDHITSKILIKLLSYSFVLPSPHMHKGEKRGLAKKCMLANPVGGESWSMKKHWFFFKSDRHLGKIRLYTYTRNEPNIYFTLSFLYFIFCTPLFHGCHRFLPSRQLQRSS